MTRGRSDWGHWVDFIFENDERGDSCGGSSRSCLLLSEVLFLAEVVDDLLVVSEHDEEDEAERDGQSTDV